MKKIILTISVFLSLISCNDTINKVIIDKKTGKDMLVGVTNRIAFERTGFAGWYNDEYSGYEPDEFVIGQIKELIDSVEIQIFMGTWCSDSRREVPRFLKIIDLFDFDQNSLQIINVDRKKTSPSHEEMNKNIQFVPTFIINDNGNEIGRIVEFPIITLESDLLSILLGINP